MWTEASETPQLFERLGLGTSVNFRLFPLIASVTQSFKSDNQFDWLFDLINMIDQIDSTVHLKWQDHKQSQALQTMSIISSQRTASVCGRCVSGNGQLNLFSPSKPANPALPPLLPRDHIASYFREKIYQTILFIPITCTNLNCQLCSFLKNMPDFQSTQYTYTLIILFFIVIITFIWKVTCGFYSADIFFEKKYSKISKITPLK